MTFTGHEACAKCGASDVLMPVKAEEKDDEIHIHLFPVLNG